MSSFVECGPIISVGSTIFPPIIFVKLLKYDSYRLWISILGILIDNVHWCGLLVEVPLVSHHWDYETNLGISDYFMYWNWTVKNQINGLLLSLLCRFALYCHFNRLFPILS
jgi:hypothetical protein